MEPHTANPTSFEFKNHLKHLRIDNQMPLDLSFHTSGLKPWKLIFVASMVGLWNGLNEGISEKVSASAPGLRELSII